VPFGSLAVATSRPSASTAAAVMFVEPQSTTSTRSAIVWAPPLSTKVAGEGIIRGHLRPGNRPVGRIEGQRVTGRAVWFSGVLHTQELKGQTGMP